MFVPSKIQLPYTRNGIQIAPFGHNIRLISKRKEMELAVFWNNDDYLMVSKVFIFHSDYVFGSLKIPGTR